MNILTNSKIQGFNMCDDISKPYNIKFNNNGISETFTITYSSFFNLFKKPKKAKARFRKKNGIIVVDYKFIDKNKWFKAHEANNQLGHYLILKDNTLAIKTLIDFWNIKNIEI